MDRRKFNECIQLENFRELFLELGWNNPKVKDLYEDIDKEEYHFRYVAEMHGFMVLSCSMANIPATAMCKRIDTKLRPHAQEYILILTQTETCHHKWIVPVRNTEKRDIVTIEYEDVNKADFLFNKLSILNVPDGANDITIQDIKKKVQESFAVNSEKITKDFFREFKQEHDRFFGFITGIDDHIKEDGKGKKKNRKKDWYTSVMLNRLMFCYFVQKKGFLDGDVNYLHNKLKAYIASKEDGTFFQSFYRGFLCALFHDGLNSPRHQADFNKKYGCIPYLNGGMFDEHELEREFTGIDIDDKAFENLFSFFDKWEWHLDTRLTASGKDINPDVLGYIFEQYINDRAAMGAYYTKEDITEYIGKNCILPFLMDKTAEKSPAAFKPNGFVWKMLQESGTKYIYDAVLKGYSPDWQQRIPDYIRQGIALLPEQHNLLERRSHWNEKTDAEFALPTEIWRETIERLQRCDSLVEKIENGEIAHINDFITYNLDIREFVADTIRRTDDHLYVRHFYEALQSVTILDPTCGSGAFLFAAMNILEPLYEACLDRMEEWRDKFKDELDEIANKYSSNRQYFIYKNIILRNLYGVDIMVEATEIAKLRLFLKMVAVVEVDRHKDNMGLDPLPDIDFNIKCGNTLVGYATEKELNDGIAYGGDLFSNQTFRQKIEDEMVLVARAYDEFRKNQLSQNPLDDNAEIKTTKKNLKARLSELNDLLNHHMHQAITLGKDYDGWYKSHQPFHWIAEFYQIIKGNGGFDVIIGNPPYVVYTKKDKSTGTAVSDCYSVKGYKTIECNNLYGFVMERSINILNNGQRIGMIVPLSFTAAKNMLCLRNLFLHGGLYVSSYEIRPGKLFDGGKGADQRLNIFISHNAKVSFVQTTEVQRWYSEHRNILFKNLYYSPSISEERILRFSNPIERTILKKVSTNTQICNLFTDIDYRYTVHYRSAGLRYWIIFLNNGFGTDSVSNKVKYVVGSNQVKHLMACLNSNLYWWYYATNYDMFNQTETNVAEFRYTFDSSINLYDLAVALEKDMDVHKITSIITKQDGNINESYAYQKKLSKPIIDEIDKVLAKHYGFTEEELDFIINYDIKYRMGDELNEE